MGLWASLIAQWQKKKKNPPANAGDCRFNPCVEKIPWRRKWQPTPAFLPGKSQGQKSLAGMESQKSWTQIGNYTTKLLISIRGRKKAIPRANIWLDITYDFSPLDMIVLIIKIITLSYIVFNVTLRQLYHVIAVNGK